MAFKINPKYQFQLIFWSVVFTINLGTDWHIFSSIKEAIEVTGLKTISQWFVAFIAIHVLVKKFLIHKHLVAFSLSLFFLAFCVAQLYITVSFLYLEPTYPDSYGAYYKKVVEGYTLIERLGFSRMIKYILISKVPSLLFPAIILIAVNIYEKQQRLLEYKEKKQAAELSALKTQLNPHFIFNTLNNIYSLAISGSQHTAEAVAKLSGIFDYVLYRCNERFVSLNAEVEMIENYIALEQLRYGNRVKISFINKINQPAQVAPLLFLTLVENAFKHGVLQELKQAEINLMLKQDNTDIIFFEINNSKPENYTNKKSDDAIGLTNLQHQLKLIYPNHHELKITETIQKYNVRLIIKKDQTSSQS